ncbi:MAG: hypothetical protein O3A00_10430 [Planctomycetota bacterium]|nr:hypothetical protein [Planctomycetota bacterium]
MYLIEAPADEPLSGDADAMSPDETTRVLDALDRMQTLSWSDEEFAAWERDRQSRREWEKSRFVEQGEELRGMFE